MIRQYPKAIITGILLFCSTFLYSQQTLTIPIDPLNPSGLNTAKNAIYLLPGTTAGTVIKPTLACPSVTFKIDQGNIINGNGSNGNVNYQNPNVIGNKTINTNLPVGVINGSAGVTPGGAATYQIPIFCSPGTNGMQPELSISYNSQSGYGSLGWGWDLFGTSSISRTSKTLIQDGVLGSVEMNGSDVFNIDGNRMYEVVNNNHIPGADTYYKTEFADFSTLYSSGYQGSGPLSFIKIETNGTIKEYGVTLNSRKLLSSNNSIGVWRLNKVTDVSGNYMVYNYNNAGLLSSIEYTGNNAAGLPPYNQIIFVYALRTDRNITYPGYSTALEDNYLLTEIHVKCDNQLVKKYVFKYVNGPNYIYSLLNEIVESDKNGVELNSTQISWNGELQANIDQLQNVNSNIALFSVPSCTYVFYNKQKDEFNKKWHPRDHTYDKEKWFILKLNHAATVYGDFNGDGYMDVLDALTNETTHAIDWKIYLYHLSDKNYNSLSSPDAFGSISDPQTNYTLVQPLSADVDGDGKDEIYLALEDSYKTNNQQCHDSVDLYCYKFDNNALNEVLTNKIENLVGRGIYGNAYNDVGYYISFMDLNGDGKENEIMFDNINTGQRFFYNHIPVPQPNIDDGCTDIDLINAEIAFKNSADLTTQSIPGAKIKFTDINGNGKPEILQYYKIMNGGWEYHYDFIEYNGSSYQQIYTMQQNDFFASDSLHAGDFNGDGKTDFLMYMPANSSYKWKLLISKGDGFETILGQNALLSALNAHTLNGDIGEIICQDYNGDGKTDVFLQFKNNNDIVAEIYYSSGRDFKFFNFGIFTPNSNSNGFFYSIGDMNGDGTADLIYNTSTLQGDACTTTKTEFVFVNPFIKPLLVKTVENGFLQTTQFDYKPMSDPEVYTPGNYTNDKFINYKGSAYLVSALKQPDGIGGTSTTSYTYAGGLIHKYGKGLLGFSKVTSQNNTSQIKTESIYVPDETFLMMNLTDAKTYMNNATTPTSLIHNTYNSVSLNGDNDHGYFKGVFNYIGHSTITDNLTGIVLDKDFTYGDNADIVANKGNAKTLTEAYGNDGSVVTTNTFEEDSYTPTNFTDPISLTKLKKTVVVKTIGSESFTKNIEYTYNSSSLLESLKDFSNLNNGAITTTYDYEHDHEGNIVADIHFGNIMCKKVSASGMVDRYTDYQYETEKGRFLTKETNMLGQETHYDYNAKFGLKTSVTDVLGNTITYQYDGFGSLIQENLPHGYNNVYGKHWYQNTDIPHCLFYTTSVMANAPDGETYFDAFGRELGSMTIGMGNIPVYTNKEYNAKGQLSRTCLPYRSGQTKKWVTNSYNNNNQLASVDNYGLVTTYGYSGKTITETDPDGHSKSKTLNNMGLVVSADDQGGTITYTYHGSGAVAEVTTGGSTIRYDYDTHGRLKGVNDPDAGVSTTEYNGFGEITQQQDANDFIYTFAYDDAGRLETKTGPEGEYSYTYIPVTADSCGGLLSSTALYGESTTYAYTRFGQILTETKVINGVSHVYNYGYDNKGNKLSVTYPNGFGVKRVYDSEGRLITVNRADNQTCIWQIDAVNELGLPILSRQGDNVLNTTYTYDNYYHLTGISNLRQNDTYVWDAKNGNLSSRSNHIKNLTETFDYDDLNRLTEIRLNNVLVKEMDYEPNGNIASKTDAGEYLYDPVKVHAVKQIEGDANTAISQARQDVTYTAFNKIKNIVERTPNTDSLVYLYGPDMQRNRMELYDNNALLKSRVYDGLYETQTIGNNTAQYCYIEGGSGITAVMVNKIATNTMYYLLRDQQGSITGLVDDQRNLVEEYSYDAWGRRRNPNTWTYDNTPVPQFIFRGYTMHEMLDEFALINMNGRCYDPVVGRFLSPDIVIQDGNNTQCYNKYSYCVNNPLKYNDPSGWSWSSIQAIRYAEMVSAAKLLNYSWHQMLNELSGNNSIVKIIGQNAILFQTPEVNHQLAIAEIADILNSVLSIKGLFGNPEEDTSPFGPESAPPRSDEILNDQQSIGLCPVGKGNYNNYSSEYNFIQLSSGVSFEVPPGTGYQGPLDGVYIRNKCISQDYKKYICSEDITIKLDDDDEYMQIDVYDDCIEYDKLRMEKNISDIRKHHEDRTMLNYISFGYVNVYLPYTFYPISQPPAENWLNSIPNH